MKPTQTDVLKMLQQAQEAFLKQDFPLALQQYLEIEKNLVGSEASLPAIWIEIGWNYYLLNQFENALDYLERALTSPHLNQKQVFDCLRLCGFCFEYTGNPDKALAFLQDALTQPLEEQEKRYVYFEIGKIFYSQNLTLEAKPYLEKALALFGPADAAYRHTTRYYLGFIQFYNSGNAAAKALFQLIIAEAPDDASRASGYFGLAHLQYEQKEYRELIDCCRTITELDPAFFDRETLGFFLCRAYLELQMWTELSVFLPMMIKQYPQGRYSQAYEKLEIALRTRSNPLLPPGDTSQLN